jgi:hypothetical protein
MMNPHAGARRLHLIAACLLGAAVLIPAPGAARAETKPPVAVEIPPALTSRHEKLKKRLTPSAAQKASAAAKVVAAQFLTADASKLQEIAKREAPGGMDIEDAVFLLMMEMAKSANEDLKAILEEAKAVHDARARLRAVADKLKSSLDKDAGAATAKKPSTARTPHIGAEYAVAPDVASLPDPKTLNDRERAALAHKIDAMLAVVDQAESMNALLLQNVTGRQTKLVAALANLK